MGHKNDQQQETEAPQALNTETTSSHESRDTLSTWSQIQTQRRAMPSTYTVQRQDEDDTATQTPTLTSPLFRQHSRLLNSIAAGYQNDSIPAGASAPYIGAIQMALQQLFPDYSPSTYGTMDKETLSALDLFREREGLPASTYFGQETLLALDAYGFSSTGDHGQAERPAGHNVKQPMEVAAKVSATAGDLAIAQGQQTHIHEQAGEAKGMYHGEDISGVRVFSGPGRTYKLKFTVLYNDDITLLGHDASGHGWALIRTASGQEGWMDENYVTTSTQTVEGQGILAQSDLHLVKENNLQELVTKKYGAAFIKEHDARLVIHAVAQLNEGRLALYYNDQNRDLAFWERWLLSQGGEDARSTYQSVGIRSDLNLLLPKANLIEQMKAAGQISSGSINDEYGGAIDFMKMYAGYQVGIFVGLKDGLVETFVGLWDLIKLIGDLFGALFRGELSEKLSQLLQGLWDFITNLPASADKWWQEFKQKSPYDQGHTIGRGVGMIAFEVLVALLTAGAGTAIKGTALAGRLASVSAKVGTAAVKLKGVTGKAETALKGLKTAVKTKGSELAKKIDLDKLVPQKQLAPAGGPDLNDVDMSLPDNKPNTGESSYDRWLREKDAHPDQIKEERMMMEQHGDGGGKETPPRDRNTEGGSHDESRPKERETEQKEGTGPHSLDFERRLTTRVNNTEGFTLIHSPDEIAALVSKGKQLGLKDSVIDDLLYISCRDDKPIKAAALADQMDNYMKVIERGYPFKFANKAELERFSQELKSGLDGIGVDTSDVRIQGSALRTPNANDVDLVAMISDADFDGFVSKRFSKRITKNGEQIDLSGMNHDQLMEIAADYTANPSLYNNQAKSFRKAMVERKIASYSSDKIVPGAKALYKKLRNDYPDLNIENISIQTRGGSMDLEPFINL